VGDAGVVEFRADGGEAEAFVKAQGMGLRAEFDLCHAGHGTKPRDRRLHQVCAEPGAARLSQDADPADLAGFAQHQKPGGADGFAVLCGQKVDRLVVLVVHLIRLRDPLFFDEHGAAEGAAGSDVAGFGDQRHAK
jgi:hypothetical protein